MLSLKFLKWNVAITKERIGVFHPKNTKSWVNPEDPRLFHNKTFLKQTNLIRKHFQTWSGYLIITLKAHGILS